MMSRLQRDTRLSRYQKGRTNLDFTEARDIGWQWHQLQDYASLYLAPDDHAITPPLSVFTGRIARTAAQPTASKH